MWPVAAIADRQLSTKLWHGVGGKAVYYRVSDVLDLEFTSSTYFKSKTFPLIYPSIALRSPNDSASMLKPLIL